MIFEHTKCTYISWNIPPRFLYFFLCKILDLKYLPFWGGFFYKNVMWTTVKQQYKARLLLRCIHHFKSKFNLQYGPYAHFGYWTLVSDPWPNKVAEKVESDAPKVPKEAEAKRNGVIKPLKLQIQSISNTENLDALKTLRINRSRP